MQGTAKAVDVKNKFLQDVDGPTFQDFFNGPSLNRIVVRFKFIDIGFFLKQVNTFIQIESKFEYFQKQVDV